MPRVFLTAEWRNLIIVSYRAPARLVAPFLPEGLELEPIGPAHPGDATVSLVAFQFLRTRVFGVPWPGMVDFPEWNLRFYVRTRAGEGEAKRGVVFVREFVPSRVVSFVARGVYNEPYAAAPMTFTADLSRPAVRARCTARFAGAAHTLEAEASDRLVVPPESSTEHLLKEHQWGFGRTRDGRTLCYEVDHPVWRVHENATCRVDVDWARLYGAQWSVMQGAMPFSTVLAEGSAVKVMSATRL